jgi:hypothetical protein
MGMFQGQPSKKDLPRFHYVSYGSVCEVHLGGGQEAHAQLLSSFSCLSPSPYTGIHSHHSWMTSVPGMDPAVSQAQSGPTFPLQDHPVQLLPSSEKG